jgi:hypothetical protein
MFKQNKLQEKYDTLNIEFDRLSDRYDSLYRDSRNEIKDKGDEINRIRQNTEFEILERTKTLMKENAELRVSKEKADNKVAILEKAFENLGFDVKDMKDILGKLVDGIVSKNEVKLIQSK